MHHIHLPLTLPPEHRRGEPARYDMIKLAGPLGSSTPRRAAAALLAWLALAAPPAWAAGLVTIVEGDATLIDGARTLIVAEGLTVPDEAILRTGAKTSLVRIEWSDGTAADFGPETQAMINPAGFAARGGRPPSVYLLRGWLKQSATGSTMSGGFAGPRVDVQPFKGAMVAMLDADETWVFAESGALQVGVRDARPAQTLALKSGEVYARSGAARPSVAPRPTPPQMLRVPRSFRDTLPLRTAALKGRKVEPRLAPAPPYAELREWLTVAEPPLRRTFGVRAREAPFRGALVENLGAHPEWERLLFPERFVKPAPPPSR
jgi:hypothetical protein